MEIQSTCTRVTTNEIFSDFLSCQYKAYLKIQGRKGLVSEYQAMQDQQSTQFHIHAKECLCSSDVEFDVETISREYSARIHALQHPSHDSATAKLSAWVPILFSPRDNISKNDKLLLAYWGLLLSKTKLVTPAFGRIIHGRRYQNTKIDLTKLFEQANHVLNGLSQLKQMKEPPQLYLNKHCNICEFKDQCHSLAIEQDNLSLLRGLTPKDIKKLNSKGIFTVNQYSYTFRPRRKRKRPTNYKRKHHPELQALAIKEDKIFIYETPKLPTTSVHIYFDVEGIPDWRSYYLIGIVIEFKNRTVEHSFWADNEEEELKIFRDFLTLLSNYDDYTLYHYGSYDTTYLKRMIFKVSSTEKRQIEKVLTRCCNLLSFFHSNIYMPTYSNGLKDIASYLGHQWAHAFGSGIQSIVWRTQWMQEHSKELELRLKRYNLDDCYALPVLHLFIAVIIENDTNEKAISSAIDSMEGKDGDELLPQNIEYYHTLKSQSNLFSKKYVFDEMEYIRKCSYFDYQRQRVFVRTGPSRNKLRPGQRQRRKAKSIKNTLRTNEVVNIIERVCGRCHSPQIICTPERLSKKVIDLKFTKSGVKKWVIQYVTNRYRCKACGFMHVPTRYKEIIYKFGHALMSLAIYHHIVNRHSSRQIQTNFYELFGIVVPHDTILRFMSYFAEYYKWTYGLLQRRILASRVVYADETPLKTKYEDAYVWVFTNNREVVSFYKETREGEFLVDYLTHLRDFYLDKLLIHRF